MANIQAKDVAKAVRAVLAKHDGEAQKATKLQRKVLKKLSKKHGDGVDAAHVAELLQQLLANNSDFLFDGRKVSLQQPGAAAAAAQPAQAAAAVAAAEPAPAAAAAAEPAIGLEALAAAAAAASDPDREHKQRKDAAAAAVAGSAAALAAVAAAEAAAKATQNKQRVKKHKKDKRDEEQTTQQKQQLNDVKQEPLSPPAAAAPEAGPAAPAAVAAPSAAAAAQEPLRQQQQETQPAGRRQQQQQQLPQQRQTASQQLLAQAMQRTQQQREQQQQQKPPLAKPGTGRHTVLKAETAAPAAAAAVAGGAAKAHTATGSSGAGSSGAAAAAAAVDSSWRADYNRTDVKHGRFDDDERATIAAAIQEYAEERSLPYGLGECDWLVDPSGTGHKRGAITAIAAALPQRTRKAVWQFVRSNYTPTEVQGKWSSTEDERLLAFYNELGPKWKEIGSRLGRLDRACRDRARDLNYGQPVNTGRWTDDEVDLLQNLVDSYRQAVAVSAQGDAPRTLSNSLLPSESTQARPVACTTLDNIDWTFVARQMVTRTSRQCAEKWHAGLAPSMVEAGQWGRGDDKRLIAALAAAGATESYQVDWGSLVPGRTAEQCQRRWRLVLKHLPIEIRFTFAPAVAEAAARVRQSEDKAAAAAAAAGGGGGRAKQKRKRQAADSNDEQQQQQQDDEEQGEGAAAAAGDGGVKHKRKRKHVQEGDADEDEGQGDADKQQQRQKQEEKRQKRVRGLSAADAAAAAAGGIPRRPQYRGESQEEM